MDSIMPRPPSHCVGLVLQRACVRARARIAIHSYTWPTPLAFASRTHALTHAHAQPEHHPRRSLPHDGAGSRNCRPHLFARNSRPKVRICGRPTTSLPRRRGLVATRAFNGDVTGGLEAAEGRNKILTSTYDFHFLFKEIFDCKVFDTRIYDCKETQRFNRFIIISSISQS